MAVAMIGPKFYAWDRNGKPLAFGKLYTYQARTNTPKPTYQSEDQVVENTNPVILNGEGYANVYLDGSYKMVLKDSDENEIWSSDPVSASQPNEWVNCASASYVNTITLKVSGNLTNEYDKGRRIRIDSNTSNYSYSTIESSNYANGETTIVVSDSVVTTGVVSVCASIIGQDSVDITEKNIADLTIPYFFKTSVEMKLSSIDFPDGKKIVWGGYHSEGDGGGNFGFISSLNNTPDDGSIFLLSSGKYVLAEIGFDVVEVLKFGAKCDGSTDDSDRCNAAILFAYKNKRVAVLPQDEVWSPTVKWPTGVDCSLADSLIIPSGVILDFNGSRVTGGDTGAGTKVYDPNGLHLIQTGYYDSDSDSLIKNTDLALNEKRLVGSRILNATFAFANCALNLANMNEQCLIENIRYANCSRIMRIKACFYLSLKKHISRQSAALIGHQAIELYGNDNNAMTFEAVNVANAGIGLSLSGGANFTISFTNGCSFEESKSVNGIGIFTEAGSFVSGVKLDGVYFEGVTTAIHNKGAMFGLNVTNCIFNNNQNALLGVGSGSSLRVGKWFGNSLPDGGGSNRNLINVANGINDLNYQVPDIGGYLNNPTILPDTIIHGIRSGVDAEYQWLNAAQNDLLGVSTPPNGAKNDIIKLPYAGRGGVAVTNEPPFCVVSRDGDDIIVQTQLKHDNLNMLAFNFFGNSTNVTWDVKGIILGDLVQLFTPAGFTLSLNSLISGNSVSVRISRDIGDFGATVNLTGAIRHM